MVVCYLIDARGSHSGDFVWEGGIPGSSEFAK